MTVGSGGSLFGTPSQIETREEFADALTALRTRAGLSVRALAQALATPTATVGDYCSGRHLPGPAQQELFVAMLRKFGVQEQDLSDWLQTVARLRAVSDGRMRRAAAPYQGLAPFMVDDQERFFGREAMTAEVLERLQAGITGARSGGIILVVGASGAGKSSLLRAGVQAAISAGELDTPGSRWSSGLFTPGEAPQAALRACLGELPDHERVVIVDQFEEIFALPVEERDRFLSDLDRLAVSGTPVIAGMRADFYDRALRAPGLLASLRAGAVLLAPMTETELRAAITGPAAYVGAQLEEGLVDLLVADLSPREATGFAHDAGALPLLSHALLQSWERARGNRLAIADYRAAGGLHGAVRQSAEEVFGQLTGEQQALARRVFMRLVRVPENGPPVRRRARRQELEALTHPPSGDHATGTPPVAEVIGRFVDARLVTADAEAFELSHEALLTAWPRLGNWLEENREGLRLHGQLADATGDWVAAGRDPDLLLRGPRLQLIGEWAGEPENRTELNPDELALLTESQRVALSERRASRRRVRQMRGLATASLISAVAAIVLALVALHARDTASAARDDALSRQLALQARTLTPVDPSLSMQLAVLAHEIAPTTDATSALLDTSSEETPTRLTGPAGPAYLSAAPGAKRLAAAYSAADRIRIYTLADGIPHMATTITAGPASAQVFAVALSPNGQLLAAGGTDHKVVLWSLASLAHPTRIATLTGLAGTVYGLSFSARGSLLAAVDDGRSVTLWSIQATAAPILQSALITPKGTQVHAVQFAASGTKLAAASAAGQVLVWPDPSRGSAPLGIRVPAGTTLTTLAFSPDGRMLAAGGETTPVYRWALNGAQQPIALSPLRGFSTWVDSLAFSPDGRYLVAGGSDNSLRVWSTRSPDFTTALGHPAAVTGVAFSSDGQHVFSIDAAGTLRQWRFPPPSTLTAPGDVFGLNYTADGKELAVISSGAKGDAELWKTVSPDHPVKVTRIATPASFGAVAGAGTLSSSGKLLAVANARARILLFNVSDPRSPQTLGRPLTGATPYVEQMTFNPAGRLLAAGDDGGHVHLWNLADPHHPLLEPSIPVTGPGQSVLGVAFSPNGHLLATASTDGRVRLWDTSAPNHSRPLGTVGRFTGYAYTVAFAPDGRTLVAGGADRTVRLWNITNPAHPHPDSAPLSGPTSSIYNVTVDTSGSLAAAATTDGAVWLWNIRNPSRPRLVADLTGSAKALFAASFRPHTHMLIAGGADQLLHIWNDRPASVATILCKTAGTAITRAEWRQYVKAGPYSPPCDSVHRR